MSDSPPADDADPTEEVTSRELFRTFGKIGLLSFGGPAGQIALMHRILVEEKGWLEEKRFLHALNFCMLLPGPEAMQLATYSGWLLRGVSGGILAGSLFVLPGVAVLLALSLIYVNYANMPPVASVFFGLKAAVLAIVLHALWKVASRALRGPVTALIALIAFAALFVFAVPFPAVVLCALLAGYFLPRHFAQGEGQIEPSGMDWPFRHVPSVSLWGIIAWAVPLVLLFLSLGGTSVYFKEAVFFSKVAMVTFGGAYAVLTYVGQQAVEVYGWLRADEMLTGLGLAETTPGPLILVLVFVGFMGAFRDAGGLDPVLAGIAGGLVTVWVTFIPCFIWIFLGAPFMEVLRGNVRMSGALAAVTAAVVGVIANLSLWFASHVLFAEQVSVRLGPGELVLPNPASAMPVAILIFVLAAAALWRGFSLVSVLLIATVSGILAGQFAFV